MKTRVAVIYGGRSGEHEVSLRSAKSIMDAMDPEKYKILHYLISKEGKWSPRPIVPEPRGNPEIDVVFPVLHGTFGEDGTHAGSARTGRAALRRRGRAGFVRFDGQGSHEAAGQRARIAGGGLFLFCAARDGRDVEAICGQWGFPVFVKPANLGSSVGISKAQNCVELKAAIGVGRLV